MNKLLLVLTIAFPAQAAEVLAVTDGDTLTVMQNSRPVTIRLANIDAPEEGQPSAAAATQSLIELCLHKEASLWVLSADRQGKLLAVVSCDGVEANQEQVRRGLAWVIPKSNIDPALPDIQSVAWHDRSGIWAEPAPVPPWEWRVEHMLPSRKP